MLESRFGRRDALIGVCTRLLRMVTPINTAGLGWVDADVSVAHPVVMVGIGWGRIVYFKLVAAARDNFCFTSG